MSNIENLKKEQNEIEEEIEKAKKKLNNLGTLSIRINNFERCANLLESNNDIFLKKAKEFKKQIIHLSNLRSKKNQENVEEMIRSKLQPETPITDISECTDSEFFRSRTERVNNILLNAMDALDSVKRQGRYIEKTNAKIKNGLRKLGLSRDLVDEIDRRYLADNMIFVRLFIVLIIFFFILRFWFR